MRSMELKMQPTTHRESKPGYGAENIPVCYSNVLWVESSNPSGSLSLVKYPVYESANHHEVFGT
jgi:hypothetical protein